MTKIQFGILSIMLYAIGQEVYVHDGHEWWEFPLQVIAVLVFWHVMWVIGLVLDAIGRGIGKLSKALDDYSAPRGDL